MRLEHNVDNDPYSVKKSVKVQEKNQGEYQKQKGNKDIGKKIHQKNV